MACMCGDSECPDYGRAQGTFTEAPRDHRHRRHLIYVSARVMAVDKEDPAFPKYYVQGLFLDLSKYRQFYFVKAKKMPVEVGDLVEVGLMK